MRSGCRIVLQRIVGHDTMTMSPGPPCWWWRELLFWVLVFVRSFGGANQRWLLYCWFCPRNLVVVELTLEAYCSGAVVVVRPVLVIVILALVQVRWGCVDVHGCLRFLRGWWCGRSFGITFLEIQSSKLWWCQLMSANHGVPNMISKSLHMSNRRALMWNISVSMWGGTLKEALVQAISISLPTRTVVWMRRSITVASLAKYMLMMLSVAPLSQIVFIHDDQVGCRA